MKDESGFLRSLVPACLAAARRNRRSPWLPAALSLLICLGVFGVIQAVRSAGWLELIELKAYDFVVSRRWLRADESMASRIAVIGVTERDIQAEVVQFPISDEEMATLLTKLLSYKPRAIGVDIFRDLPAPDRDSTAGWQEQRAALLDLLRDKSVISVMELPTVDDPVAVRGPEGVDERQLGFADFPNDDDDTIRKAILFMDQPETGSSYTSLPMRVAVRYLRGEEPRVRPEPVPGHDDWVRLGRSDIRRFTPDDGAYVNADAGGLQMLLDFKGKRHVEVIPVGDVLSGKRGAEAFADKAVLIGVTARSVKDILTTAVNPKEYGVVAHATVVDQLLRAALTGNAGTRVWPDWAEGGWALAWALLGGLLGYAVRSPWRFLVLLVAGAVLLALAVYSAFVGGLWVPLLPPLFGWLGAAGFVTQYISHHERAQRTVLNDLFRRMVSDDVATTLWARRDELFDEGRLAASEVQATVLFTDLQGFTSISEAMDKTCLMTWLNRYMTEMSQIVEAKGGFVNKYIGDAVMAVFGPPLERTPDQSRQDAVAAVECALAMRESLAARLEEWTGECLDGVRKKLRDTGRIQDNHDPTLSRLELRMRVGIYSGPVVAGSLGSAQRLEYTVIGDTVNTAARLESFDKSLMGPDIAAGGCRILIGQPTLDQLGGKYQTREVGSIMLKGKRSLVTIHGVVGRRTGTTAAAPPAESEAAGTWSTPEPAAAIE